MNIFLRAKHWQLFILLVGVPIVLDIFGTLMLVLSHNPRIMMRLFPILMLIVTVTLLGWYYALGINLYNKQPAGIKLNIKTFRLFFFIPVIYFLAIFLYMFCIFNGVSWSGGHVIVLLILSVFGLHLFSMFCIFYLMYFIAKELKMAELQREVTFSDYVGEFFLLWFFPVGVWIIQPRINRIFTNGDLSKPK